MKQFVQFDRAPGSLDHSADGTYKPERQTSAFFANADHRFLMDIVQKGEEFEPHLLVLTLKWSTPTDFDLAAGYETREGKQGLVYYGNRGDLNRFPFIELSTDEGVADAEGTHEETLRVANVDEMKSLWLFCWDYGQIQTGEAARFNESDISITLQERNGKATEISPNSGEVGNVCLLASIDCNNPIEPHTEATIKSGTLKGLRNLSQLLSIVEK